MKRGKYILVSFLTMSRKYVIIVLCIKPNTKNQRSDYHYEKENSIIIGSSNAISKKGS